MTYVDSMTYFDSLSSTHSCFLHILSTRIDLKSTHYDSFPLLYHT